MKRLGLFALLAVLALSPAVAKADSIVLDSHTGDTYNYRLQLDDHFTAFILSGFSLTGMTGVYDATLTSTLNNIFDVVYFDSSSVYVGTVAGATASFTAPYTIGTLHVKSAAGPGPVDFTILDSNGLFVGSVTGPDVAATPEPSSLLLLGTGMLGAAGALRRKIRAGKTGGGDPIAA